MPSSLLLVVFLVELAVQVVNSVGAAGIANALWNLYNYIPSKRSAAFVEQRKLQAEYLKIRRDLHATSSQDEFAKWARLRRQHDKALEALEKKKTALNAGRRSFDTAVTVVRLALTRGPQYLLPFWYAREPMFWLPHGWFPAYAEWLVSFPRAPRGSVSIVSWQLACTGVLVLLKDTILALAAVVAETRARSSSGTAGPKEKTKEAPVAAEAQPAAKATATASPAGAEGSRKDQ